MALATKSDFEARHGEADDRIESLLEDASALILSELADSEAEWVTSEDAEVPAAVVGVCVSIAYRAWSNPDALSSASLGERSQAWADRSGEALRITDVELRILEREAGVLSSMQSLTLESPYAGPQTEGELL